MTGSFARQLRIASIALEIHAPIVSQKVCDAAGAAELMLLLTEERPVAVVVAVDVAVAAVVTGTVDVTDVVVDIFTKPPQRVLITFTPKFLTIFCKTS